MDHPGDCVDMRECKATIGRLCPRGHPLREALLREPDYLSLEEARSKLPIYLRMALADGVGVATA